MITIDKKILIITRVLPHWRREIFEEINRKARSSQIETLYVYDHKSKVMGNHKSSGMLPTINSLDLKIKKNNVLKFETMKGLKKIVKEFHPTDILLEASPRFLPTYTLLQRNKNYRVWGWTSGYFKKYDKYRNFFRKLIFKRFDGLFTYHSLATKYFKEIGIKNVITVGNSPGDKKIHQEISTYTTSELINLKKQFTVSDSRLICLFVGKLTKPKKVEVLLETARIIKDKCLFLIVGEGPEKLELENQKKKNNLNNVIFLGEIVETVNKYFQIADVFILPGTGGLALVQALYNGKSIISSYADGIGPDAVINNVNGYIQKNITAKFLSDKLAYLSENKSKLSEFEKNSVKLSVKFSTSSIAEKMIFQMLK